MKCFSSDCNFIVNRYEINFHSYLVHVYYSYFNEDLNNSFIPLFDKPPRLMAVI